MPLRLARLLAIIVVVGLAAIGFSQLFFHPATISPAEAARSTLDFIEKQAKEIKSKLTSGTAGEYIYGDLIGVKEVIDGDTIVLDNGEKVRYIGVDTPELDDNTKGLECYGIEATERNRDLVKGKQVRLFKDVSERDRYGRLLAYVYRDDGVFVNYELVKGGFAVAAAYPPDVQKAELFSVMEREARADKTGMWGNCNKK